LVKELTALRVTYGRSFIIDDTLMSANQREKYKNLLSDLQPYFDKLNGELSSRDVLSAKEFDDYMEATIVLQRIASELGESQGYVLPDKVPADKKDAYDHANKILKQVREKTEVKFRGIMK
jgi:hypothetical protein